jgi:8-oxo-(d)GTP phosphatase
MTEATTLAAGAAIWRPPADPAQDAEVLLVHRPTYDDWSLPKGKSDAGEHILLTAVREVWEETCVRPVLGPRLPTVEYISWGRPKQVSYWSSFSDGHQAAPGNEIDAVSWLPLGRKADWSGDDCLRPLDAAGVADARVLASLMACFAPVARVISSPALRCSDTVRPYAAGFSGTVETEPCLAPYGRSADFSSRTGLADSLRRLLSRLLAERRPTVLCLHRENLPDVLAEACSVLGAPAAVPADPSLPKGGFWVAHASVGGSGGASRAELASLERYEP